MKKLLQHDVIQKWVLFTAWHQTLFPTVFIILATIATLWKFDLHQTSSSTSSNVSFVLRCEQQCCIRLAITFNSVARVNVLRLSVSMVIRCICFARWHVSWSYGMVNKQSLECLSEEKIKQSLFAQIVLLVQVKTPGRYSLCSDTLGLLKVPHTCMVQELWRPGICCCSSQILEQPSSCYHREWLYW